MPIDYTTKIGQVRLLIPDTNESLLLLTDEQIEAFLTLESDNVRLAAALALETIASSEALVSKKIRDGDLQTDGPAVAKELRERAKELRAQAAEIDDDGDAFGIGVIDFDPYAGRY